MEWTKPDVNGQTPTIKNHTSTLVGNQLLVFGGYDGRKNHSTVHILCCDTWTWRVADSIEGKTPEGRNGHTATLAGDRIFFIGGWLGSGPLAASDMHILDVGGMPSMAWIQPETTGTPPGPCNMHTADFISSLNEIFVFRGGDGKEYLNDLHGLNITSLHWRGVEASGQAPLQRANHSSAVVDSSLFIFGGWDGHRRLNDIHRLDTAASQCQWKDIRCSFQPVLTLWTRQWPGLPSQCQDRYHTRGQA